MVTINSHFRNSFKGFGLVELLVSVTIITMVTSIVISRHNAFNGAVLLRNQAYEVAFAIRKAQQLAVSGTSNVRTEKQRVGIAFARSSGLTGVPGQIIIFKDRADGDGNYSGTYISGNDDLIQVIKLDPRFHIAALYDGSNPPGNRGTLHILFERPLFNANFRRGIGDGAPSEGPVFIHIGEVSGGAVRVIEVTASGQVRVL